jgi:hypothetical protein
VDLDAPAAAAASTPGGTTSSSNGGNGNGANPTGRCADLLARLLPQWIPKGQDLYVFGVQECASLPRLRELLRAYLDEGAAEEKEGGGRGYAVFKTEIGDDTLMHGFIALTIFVRQGDVASGAFRLHQAGVGGVATGVGLGPMGRASNKVRERKGLSCLAAVYVSDHLSSFIQSTRARRASPAAISTLTSPSSRRTSVPTRRGKTGCRYVINNTHNIRNQKQD